MRHPELLGLPVLMLADYVLTVAGVHWRLRVYSRHFKTEHYELNPVWQKAMQRPRWFNPRHLLLTAAFTAALAALIEAGGVDDRIADFVVGALYGAFGSVIGRHLANLWQFAYLGRHAEALSGEVAISHDYVLTLSAAQYLGTVLPLGLLAALAPSPLSLGALSGAVLLLALHLAWRRRHRRR